MKFHKDILRIDAAAETERVCEFIRQQVGAMKRDGAVVGVSGGIDSAVAAALCSRALGKDQVLGLVLPERESNPVSVEYALKHAAKLGIKTVTVDITPALEGLGTYQKRNEFIKKIFPEYSDGYTSKITLPPDLLARDAFNIFTLQIDDGKGNVKSKRLDARSMHGIIAATNTKQRTRMIQLYYHAELNNYLVCGTTNRSEDVQGFFVKYGDGGVDIEPTAHLYKMQVYQLGDYLGVIREIMERAPSPDTFSFVQSDQEFYFRMPYDALDPLLYAWENGVPVPEVCQALSLGEEQVKRVFRDFNAKAAATNHLHSMPPVPGAWTRNGRPGQ
jgi:NAD+ synthase